MPKISIIVPVYNVEKYIHRCVDSILSQRFTDFELILVDDGSPDKCGEICDEYAKKDNRIKVIHKENAGLAEARNSGLEIARGEYVGFVDSDDYIDENMYDDLYSAINKYNVKISMCGRYNVFPDRTEVLFTFIDLQLWNSGEAIERLLLWNGIDSSSCDKLFNKDLFKDVRFPSGKYNEDVFIMATIIDTAQTIVHIGKPYYYYLQRENSITKESFSEKKMDLLYANQKVFDFVSEKYQHLIMQAESFKLKGIIYLISLLQDKTNRTKYKVSYKFLNKILTNNIFNIMKNAYIDRMSKIKALLVLTNLYPVIKFTRNVKLAKINKSNSKGD